ncbi:dTDP-glucose 4,6-dehydratase [bacterium]|nr:dTDP-glucose 4,6-dehydratase [bacterium]
MQRILITGGCGFIGSNLIHMLLEQEPELSIVNLDKLSYAGNPQNLSDVTSNPRYSFIKGDVAHRGLIDELVSGGGFDGIMHLAAESMVDRSIVSAMPFVESNIVGSQVLLDALLKLSKSGQPVPRFLMVSTDEVYGSLGSDGEFTEQSPLAPNNPYSASKASADLMGRAYFRTHGLPIMNTRCSNNYGPRQFPEKLIPLMIQKALKDEQLPVYGDGQHVRDWLFVEDHCRALWTVLRQGRPGEVYNIGGGTELPNIELVRILLRQLGKPESLISFVPDRPGHDRRYAIDGHKIESELGFKAAVAFEEGLQRTIDWYLANGPWMQAIADGSYQAGC